MGFSSTQAAGAPLPRTTCRGGWVLHPGLRWQNWAGSEVGELVSITCVLLVAGRVLGLSSLPFHLIHPIPAGLLGSVLVIFGAVWVCRASPGRRLTCDGTDSAWPSTASFIPTSLPSWSAPGCMEQSLHSSPHLLHPDSENPVENMRLRLTAPAWPALWPLFKARGSALPAVGSGKRLDT